MVLFKLKNKLEEKKEQPEQTLIERSEALKIKCAELEGKLMDGEKNIKKAAETNAALTARMKEIEAENVQLKKVQSLFMDWASQQEWELPPHIRDLLPKDPVFMRKIALARVPRGRSPAEYTFNLLYFLTLPEKEQVDLGSKVFHREKMVRPEDTAGLEIVTKELHELLYYFPDTEVKMTAEYAFQATCVPEYSKDPQSEWVTQKKLALNLFDVYTRVIVKSQINRGYTYCNISSARRDYPKRLSLYAQRTIRSGRESGKTKLYKIKATCNKETGNWELSHDGVHYWEVVNYGMVYYHGHYKLTNLVMDNNPPYKEGSKGMVQIIWQGTCVYDSAED